jgi:hypothetical protein
MDALTFLQSVSGYTRGQQNGSADRPIRLATIDPDYDPFVNYPDPPPLPRVRFDGEDSVTSKRYPYVQGYIPAAGQRVYMVPVGTTYQIVGAVENSDMQGFYNSGYDYITTEFGGGASLEVSGGESTLYVDNIRSSSPLGVIGGKYYTGAARASGITSEALANIETGSLILQAGRLYHIKVKFRVYSGTTNDDWIFRIRETNLSGDVHGEFVWRNLSNSWYWDIPLLEYQFAPDADVTKNFVLTAGRLGGSGTLEVRTGGTTDRSFMVVEDMGWSWPLTEVS